MDRNDWIGLATSVGIHVGLLVVFALMTVASEPPPLGFVEVEMGSIAPGRPTEQSVEQQPEEQAPQPAPQPEEPVEEEPEPQNETKTPVELPEEAPEQPDDEVINEPEEEETVQPEPPEEQPEEPVEEQQQQPVEEEPQPLGQGDPEGSSGSPTSDEGPGSTEDRTAPFSLEGLNRDPVRAPLPEYTEKVNATIRVRIWVGPDGNITRMAPDRKGNPELEQAVFRTLRQWKFNELPPGVPQQEQDGYITFRFRLE